MSLSTTYPVEMKWIFLLFFLMGVAGLCPLVGCDSSAVSPMEQHVTKPPSNHVTRGSLYENITHVRATLGRMASMRCTAANIEGKIMVSWVRYRDVSLLAVGKFVYISDERFRVLHETDSEDWFLVIKSVGYKDEGIYECQVNGNPAARSHKYMLSVVEPRTEILGESDLYVDHASSLNLTCLVISPDPPAYVFWKKDDQLMDVSESPSKDRSSNSSSENVRIIFSQHEPRQGVTVSSLFIKRVNGSHSGTFSCMPSNSESKSMRVHVLKDDSQPAAIHTTTSGQSVLLSSTFIVFMVYFASCLVSSFKM